MKYHTLRMLLGVNLLAGCLLFQGCGLFNGRSSSEETTDIPDNELGPIEVIDTDITPAAQTYVEPVVLQPAPLVPAKPVTTPYTVMKGETISGIAYRYYLRWQDVLAINPGLDPKRLRVGQVIQLPGHVNLSKSRAAAKTVKPAKTPARSATPAKITAPKVSAAVSTGAATTYIVKKGDSLSVIAYKHGIKTSALRTANDLKSDRILVGQKLKVPGATKTVKAPVAKKTEKKVPPPPKVEHSAKSAVESSPVQVTTTPPKIEESADDAEEIEVESVAPVAPEPTNLQTYTVKEGEDVYAVAIRWGVSPKEITALNNLKSIELEPGTVLKIPSVK